MRQPLGGRPVVPLDALRPVQVLDHDLAEPQVRRAEFLLDPQQVQRLSARGGHPERLPFELRAEAQFLQVEEARSALDVGQPFDVGGLDPFE